MFIKWTHFPFYNKQTNFIHLFIYRNNLACEPSCGYPWYIQLKKKGKLKLIDKNIILYYVV